MRFKTPIITARCGREHGQGISLRDHQSLKGWMWVAASTACCLAGCGTLGGPSSAQSFFGTPSPTAEVTSTAASPNQADAPQPGLSNSSNDRRTEGQIQAAQNAVVPASYTLSDGVGPTAATAAGTLADQAYCGSCETSAWPGAACPTGTCGEVCGPQPLEPYRNAQEYIFDGGDQQPRVEIQRDWTAAGVDPTDTVVYYETLAGTVCVRPSNRVPIYAPRFGTVRQVSGLQLSMGAVGTERILAPVAPGRFQENNLAGTVVLPVAPHGEEQIGLIDAFQENYVGLPMDQILPPLGMSEARVPFEWVELFRTGQITDDELAVIGRVLQNARTWFVPESIAVEVEGVAASLIKDTQAAQDVHVYELPDKCAMRICKAASHTIANSGDVVSFTIRFDNAGVKPLGNVVILDSLSPRLDYIGGSQQASVGVRFSAEPNDVGSMVLRWEIEEPVEPNDGGVISFDCRVR